MPVSADLLAILACPSADHAPLRVESGVARGVQTPAGTDEELVCTVCGSRFPVRDGIPVLLADEATVGPNGLGVAAAQPEQGPEPTG